MPSPTATHHVALGQSIALNAPTTDADVTSVQETPASLEVRISPDKDPSRTGLTPTATHRVDVGQLTPKSVVLGEGIE